MLTRPHLILLVVSLALLTIALSLSKGSTSIPIYQLLFSENNHLSTIFLQLRIPRTAAAFVCGGLLALSGSLMQVLLQNPLADPYVLGTSSGAALLTLIMMSLGAGSLGILAGAWLGSLLAIAIILTLSHRQRWRSNTLLLSGIAIACGFSACIQFILLITPASRLHSMLFWLSGDLNDASFPWAGLLLLGAGLPACLLLAPGLNLLGRGETAARALGLPAERYRLALFLLSSLFTAGAVTVAGCVGFIGLIIPHLTRMISGYDHRITLPVSMLLGGSFLTLADTCARTWLAPQQIPVGILMALLGVPIFVWLLRRQPC